MGQSIRSSSTAGTIPTFTAISGGTATRDTNKNTTLIYTGSDVLTNILPITSWGKSGSAWIYIASATPKLVRVLGITEVDLTNPAALVYAIIIDQAISAVSGVTANYVIGDLKKYSVANVGGANGTFDGVTIVAGQTIENEIQYPLNTGWLEAKTFDASSTTFTITENK